MRTQFEKVMDKYRCLRISDGWAHRKAHYGCPKQTSEVPWDVLSDADLDTLVAAGHPGARTELAHQEFVERYREFRRAATGKGAAL